MWVAPTLEPHLQGLGCHLVTWLLQGIQVWGLFAGEGAAADPPRNVLERCLTWGVLLGISPVRGSTFPGDPRPAAASPKHPPSPPQALRSGSVSPPKGCQRGRGCVLYPWGWLGKHFVLQRGAAALLE